ncbi:MAG TPA: hypothetical protein PKU80_06575 [Candidatus Limiplasma sp.]|nr:hypothetical protein [Candidatus Limiplasma sp.]
MTKEQHQTLLNLKVQQQNEHLPCPRCGKDTMADNVNRNALSRQADIMVCDVCGTSEALLAVKGEQLPIGEWACMRPTVDFKTLSGDQVWESLQGAQTHCLCYLFERWRDECEYEDFKEFQELAHSVCPGLVRLEPNPFHAVFDSADGPLTIRFESTDEEISIIAELDEE